MTTGALPRIEVPGWLLRMLRPVAIPTDWTRVTAAAIGIGAPQVLGVLLGRGDIAMLVSIGALCASFSDVTGSYRYRVRRLAVAAVLGAAGFAAGAGAPGPWWAAAVVLLVAVPSALSSKLGELWSSGGAHMLTFCIVGTGDHSTLPVAEQVGWFLGGELLLLALAAATWPMRRTAPARGAVADVFDAIRAMFDADSTVAARQRLTGVLDTAHDVLLGGTSMSRSRVRDRLYLIYQQSNSVVEAAVSLAHAGIDPPQRTRDALAALAHATRTGEALPPYEPDRSGSPLLRALDDSIAELTESVSRGRRAQVRAQRARPGLSFGATAWWQTLRMVLCLAAAEGIGLLLGLDQAYWIAMTTALVLRPNSGSVFARTVLRALGTVIGVVLAVALLALVPAGWWMVPFIVLLAGKLPIALSRHYGLFSAVITALVLLLMSQQRLFFPQARLVDTLIGCAIVLVVGSLLRQVHEGPSLRSGFAEAVESVTDYVSRSLGGVRHGRSALRRRTYRQLAELRSRLQQRLMSPHGAAEAEAWWPAVVLLERVVDAATEQAVRGDADDLQHAQLLVSTMRTINRRLRTDPEVGPGDLRDELDGIYRQIAA
ncbi:FUSC family protein [Saccharopolyspora griseoalba]|uniref:FUSC family protein n=1 Tax=Saccharopolyspora griseoalba TaxID=1431848 RepID=A0ABW2LMJ6_9PSEU